VIDDGLYQLAKYHTIIFRIPAYQAATALYHRVKWGHFERNYIPKFVEESKKGCHGSLRNSLAFYF
jgi:hypothetical protein